MKTCRVCNYTQDNSRFPQNLSYKDGLATICKSCSAQQAKLRRESNPSHYKALKFKAPIETIQYLLSRQVCDICGEPEKQKDHRTKQVRRLAIDHDHMTGKVRGILCSDCNTGLGKYRDNIQLLGKAIEYLKQHQDKPT